MRFIKIPVRFSNGDYNEDLIEDMVTNGADIDSLTDIDVLNVNPRAIIAYNESSMGTTTLILMNGSWDVPVPISAFEKLMEGVNV